MSTRCLSYSTSLTFKLRIKFLKASVWFAGATDTEKLGAGAAALMLIYFIYSWLFGGRSSYYYDDYYGGYGGYGYGGGLSWFSWGAIMLAAYKLPPLFPELLGQYARPFFGYVLFLPASNINMFL